MLWIVLSIVGLVAVVGGVMYGVGASMPVGHVATVSRRIGAPPAAVWQALTDIDAMPSWRKELKSIQRTEGKDGLPGWVEKSGFGDIPFQVEALEPEKTMVTRIDAKSMGFGGKWTFSLKPVDRQTELTITENGEVYSPMFRFMSKYLFGHDKTIKTYLDQLAQHLEKEAGK